MNKTFTLAVITLLLMLPVYSNLVLAELSEVKAYGSDNIDGYVKPSDPIKFEVSVKDAENVSAEDISLNNVAEFDNCAKALDSYL